MRSEIQNLTFKDASIICSKYKVELSEKDYINLGLKRADDKSFTIFSRESPRASAVG